MISKLTVNTEVGKVEDGSVILATTEGGTKYTYLVVGEGSENKVRLIDVEKGYLYSHVMGKDEVIPHIEDMWDEGVLKVYKKDEIQITEAK